VGGREEEGNKLEKKKTTTTTTTTTKAKPKVCDGDASSPLPTRTSQSEQRNAAEKTKESTASVSRQMGRSKCAGWMGGENKLKLQLYKMKEEKGISGRLPWVSFASFSLISKKKQ